MNYGFWLSVVVGVLNVGCVKTGAVPSGSAFVHKEFPYAVTYDDEQLQSVMGPDWTLENYRLVEKPGKKPSLERKKGYEATYELDFNDDDEKDAVVTLPYPDLLFLSKKTNARIEVTTLLLDSRLAQKELRVLLSNLVENAAGTRSLFAGYRNAAAGKEKRFATRLIDSGPATLDGNSGLVATVERADVDQLQLDPKARWGRSRIFLVHAPFDFHEAEGTFGDNRPSKYHKYRVLLLVEYSNNPEDFEAQYPDLLRLLNKIHLLTDEMLLSYLAEPLAPCSKGTAASVSVSISALGEAAIGSAEGLDKRCANPVLKDYRFAATGEERTLEHQYDFSKPQKPAWLTQGGYREERTPQAESTTPAAPAEAPSDGAEPSAAEPESASDSTTPPPSSTPPSD